MNAVLHALKDGVLGTAELRNKLGVSRPTLMRRLAETRRDVISIGRGRAIRYGSLQPWQGLSTSRFPMIRITREGNPQSVGDLVTLAAHQTATIPEGIVYNGLPIEVTDARPSGFLGRHFALSLSDLRLPPRLTDWSDHHILTAMSRRGEDLTGNLLIGEESFARWQNLEIISKTQSDYPALAIATMAGQPPGSSAGGERPKFGAFVDGRHVLVKFATLGQSSDKVARRWADLLILESLALHIASSRGVPSAQTRVLTTDSHYFLESERFDRVGKRGRISVLSLAAVHDDPADPWGRAAVHLQNAGRLSEEDTRRLQWLDAFGVLIANIDRHPYNIVFFDEGEQLRLAPAFDQVSMLYAPTADGQLPARDFTLPHATADMLPVWDDARSAALDFWQQASDESRLSDAMRLISSENKNKLSR